MNKPKRHPMLNPNAPKVFSSRDGEQFDIVFLHKGTERSMSAGINPLNGHWMYWWDDGVHMYSSDKPEINAVVKNIREKSQGVLFDTFDK